LREMAAATQAMAAGDYTQRVRETSRDEVGDLARAFNRMANELAEVDRFRRDLIANASHELRTPIAALQAVLENLIDGVESPDRATLASMHAQVERLSVLVTQLLDLSKLEAGAMPFELRPFPLEPVLERAMEEVQLHLPSDRRGVHFSVTVGAEPVVVGDPDRLHQVVSNLLLNALRHSPPDGTIELRAAPAGDGVRIEVLDEGPGIPGPEKERVFERFYRADLARSSDEGGSGLGLAIARWIVDLHGGEIRAADRSPHGCRMIVDLPGAA
jgi:signal transduction histidine kinase